MRDEPPPASPADYWRDSGLLGPEPDAPTGSYARPDESPHVRAYCPVCSRGFRTAQGRGAHLEHSHDPGHRAYRNENEENPNPHLPLAGTAGTPEPFDDAHYTPLLESFADPAPTWPLSTAGPVEEAVPTAGESSDARGTVAAPASSATPAEPKPGAETSAPSTPSMPAAAGPQLPVAAKPSEAEASGAALVAGLVASGVALAALVASKKRAFTNPGNVPTARPADKWTDLQTQKQPATSVPLPTGIAWVDGVNGHWNPTGIRTTYSRRRRMPW